MNVVGDLEMLALLFKAFFGCVRRLLPKSTSVTCVLPCCCSQGQARTDGVWSLSHVMGSTAVKQGPSLPPSPPALPGFLIPFSSSPLSSAIWASAGAHRNAVMCPGLAWPSLCLGRVSGMFTSTVPLMEKKWTCMAICYAMLN